MKKELGKTKIPKAIQSGLKKIEDRAIYVGNDLVHLPAFKKTFNPAFINRAFTLTEITYCEQYSEPLLRYASTWAAKEAVYKALKQALPGLKLWWRSIEIIRHKPQGKPEIKIHKAIPSCHFSLTITHDGEYAWALAVCQLR
jgi:holo-[acyl-carrier protein] synthase